VSLNGPAPYLGIGFGMDLARASVAGTSALRTKAATGSAVDVQPKPTGDLKGARPWHPVNPSANKLELVPIVPANDP
jgi:hypothetical protein